MDRLGVSHRVVEAAVVESHEPLWANWPGAFGPLKPPSTGGVIFRELERIISLSQFEAEDGRLVSLRRDHEAGE